MNIIAPVSSNNDIYQSMVVAPPELIAKHADEIRGLRSNPNVIGIGAVQNKKTNEVALVYIQYSQENPRRDVHRFTAYSMAGHPYGYADIRPYLNRDDKYGNLDDKYGDFVEEPYGNEATKVNKSKMEELQNLTRDVWKNVGFLIVKTALQHYRKMGCELRMDLGAGKSAHGFYHKLGFRSTIPEVNQRIEKAIAGKLPTADLMHQRMFLPKEARDQWQKEIDSNPISFPAI
jgi:GNAT superfamily N-acetyltransferase